VHGVCQNGIFTTMCGANGAACTDCSPNTGCPLAQAPCCKPTGSCGCAVGGLVGCN
jgi:hypothetical protein